MKAKSQKSLNDLVAAYKRQLEMGELQVAYTELVKYVARLRTRFSKSLAGSYSFGSIFQGYMDYTYFYFTNDRLKETGLKLGLVLNHEKMRFEIWLLGQTKEVQEAYWNLFRGTEWIDTVEVPKYSIFERTLVDQPDFGDLDALDRRIENELKLTADRIRDALCELSKANGG